MRASALLSFKKRKRKKPVRNFEESNLSDRMLSESFSPVIEKQPSAVVKRNVEKYAAPAAVSHGGFFPHALE